MASLYFDKLVSNYIIEITDCIYLGDGPHTKLTHEQWHSVRQACLRIIHRIQTGNIVKVKVRKKVKEQNLQYDM